MVWRTRAFAAKPGNLTLIPGTLMVEEASPAGCPQIYTCAHGV